jgi:2-polyprenyl-3-methyl-5-hydroxy-6-metoxy-1,4-benzoquinol methylase
MDDNRGRLNEILDKLNSDELEILCRPVWSGAVVLDCGCGEGRIAKLLRGKGAKVIGVEIDSKKAKTAKKFCEKVINGDIENKKTFKKVMKLGFRYDFIIFSHVLEHIKDPHSVLKRYVKFLKRGGGYCHASKCCSLQGKVYVACWQIRISGLGDT